MHHLWDFVHANTCIWDIFSYNKAVFCLASQKQLCFVHKPENETKRKKKKKKGLSLTIMALVLL